MSRAINSLPNEDQLLTWLAKMLSTERYDHTLRVVAQSKLLAAKHHCDMQEAVTAAILHDCAKDLPIDAQLKQAEAFGIVLADVERSTPALLHALVGAEIAKRQFAIDSECVIDAIRWHTTGRPNMSKLEKVIFLADYTEPGREFVGVQAIRAAALRNLDEALLVALERTIAYVLQRGWLLHSATVEARNFLLLQKSET